MEYEEVSLEEILNGIDGKHPVEWLLENTPKSKSVEIENSIYKAGGYTIFRHRELRTECYLEGKLVGYIDHNTDEYVTVEG